MQRRWIPACAGISDDAPFALPAYLCSFDRLLPHTYDGCGRVVIGFLAFCPSKCVAPELHKRPRDAEGFGHYDVFGLGLVGCWQVVELV